MGLLPFIILVYHPFYRGTSSSNSTPQINTKNGAEDEDFDDYVFDSDYKNPQFHMINY